MRHRGLRRFFALRIGVLMVHCSGNTKGSPVPLSSFVDSLWTYHANRALLDLFVVVEHSGAKLRLVLEAKGFSNARVPISGRIHHVAFPQCRKPKAAAADPPILFPAHLL